MFLIKEKDEFSLDLNPIKGLREIYYKIIKETDPDQSCGSEYFGRFIFLSSDPNPTLLEGHLIQSCLRIRNWITRSG